GKVRPGGAPMKSPTLALRLSRRALAGAVIADEKLSFFDGRHLRTSREAAVRGITRYARLRLDQTRPRTVVIDCPLTAGSGTATLLEALRAMLAEAGAEIRFVATGDVLQAYGVPALESRIELRRVVDPLFPELADLK